MHTNMHTGYTYTYLYICILLFNPYAACFNHPYEGEGNGMAQAPPGSDLSAPLFTPLKDTNT